MKLTKEDVWGNYAKHTRGMVVARHDEKCPVFGDTVPYKSVTVVCDEDQYDDVRYWLDYIQGGDCVSDEKVLPDGKIAIRADYQCW